PGLYTPLIAPKATDLATGTQANRTSEARKSAAEVDRNTVDSTTRAPVPPAISRSPRSELRNAGQSSPVLVRPSRQEREARATVGLAPNTYESLRPGSDGRSVAIQAQQRQQSEFRPQPGQRPDAVAEEQTQFRYQPRSADQPSFRQESRRVESGAPTFLAPPANSRPAGQSITPPPIVL